MGLLPLFSVAYFKTFVKLAFSEIPQNQAKSELEPYICWLNRWWLSKL